MHTLYNTLYTTYYIGTYYICYKPIIDIVFEIIYYLPRLDNRSIQGVQEKSRTFCKLITTT